MARDAHGHVLFTSRRPDRAHGPPRRLQRRPLTTASQRATPPRNPIYIPRNRLVNHPQPFPVILRSSYHSLCMPFVPATDACNPIYFPTPANASLSLTLLQTHLCRNDPASARGSLLRSPPPHPSSLPSPPVPSGLPRAHFPPLSTSTPLPLTPPFSPLPHTSLNPHTLPNAGPPRHDRVPHPPALFKHVASTSRRPSIAVPAVTQPATAAPAASTHPPLLYLLPPSLPSPYPPPSLPLPYFLPLPSLLSLFCITLPPRSLPSPYLPPPSRAAHSLPSPTRRTFRRHRPAVTILLAAARPAVAVPIAAQPAVAVSAAVHPSVANTCRRPAPRRRAEPTAAQPSSPNLPSPYLPPPSPPSPSIPEAVQPAVAVPVAAQLLPSSFIAIPAAA